MPQVRSLALLPRLLQSKAERALSLLQARLPVRVQRLALQSMQRLARRLPELQRVLGMWKESAGKVRKRGGRSGVVPKVPIDAEERGELLERLRLSPDFRARSRAAKALAAFQGPEVMDALVVALEDRSAEVAFEAAQSLKQHAGPRTVAALQKVIENKNGYFNVMARSAAVSALSALLAEGEHGPIASAVADADAEVSLAAIGALVERDARGSVGVLLSVLESRDGYYLPLTRQAAARGLPELDAEGKSRVRALLETEADAQVRTVLSSKVAGP